MFEEVKVTGFRYRTLNGKRIIQSKEFMQMLTPENKNKAGMPKSRDEIVNELRSAAQAWEDEKEPENG